VKSRLLRTPDRNIVNIQFFANAETSKLNLIVACWGKVGVCSLSAEEEIGFVPHALTTFVTTFAAITGV